MSNKYSFVLWVATLLLVSTSTSLTYVKAIAVLGCLIQVVRYAREIKF